MFFYVDKLACGFAKHKYTPHEILASSAHFNLANSCVGNALLSNATTIISCVKIALSVGFKQVLKILKADGTNVVLLIIKYLIEYSITTKTEQYNCTLISATLAVWLI